MTRKSNKNEVSLPRSASYGVYMSQLIRFARVSSPVDEDS